MSATRFGYAADVAPLYTCLFHDGASPDLRARCHRCGRLLDAAALRWPRDVDRFRVLGLVGQGYNGHVLRVRNTETGRTGALKMTPVSFDETRNRGGNRGLDEFATPEAVAALRRVSAAAAIEARGTAALRLDGSPLSVVWTELELVDGLRLDRALADPRLRAPGVAERLAADLVRLDAELAAAGVNHNDLFPGNVLVSGLGGPHPRVRVVDFDFAAPFRIDVAAGSDPRVTEPSDHEWVAAHLAALAEAVAGQPAHGALRAVARLVATDDAAGAAELLADRAAHQQHVELTA